MKLKYSAMAWCATWLATGALHAETGAAAHATPEIPGVTISYYDVSGGNETKIRKAINRLRPVDPDSKKPFDGTANYSFGWGWPRDAKKQCDLTKQVSASRQVSSCLG